MAAFLAPGCPEVFHSVATPTAIWKADPYDVETIHAEARAAFEHLLNRAGRTPPPPSGAVLVLLGEAGSGKTHLMRAFPNARPRTGAGLLRLPPDDGRGEQLRPLHADQPDRRPGATLRPRTARRGPGSPGCRRRCWSRCRGCPGSTWRRSATATGDPTRLADDYADRLQTAPAVPRLRPRTAPGDAPPGTQRTAGPQPGADVAAVPGYAAPGPRVDRRGSRRAPTTPTR